MQTIKMNKNTLIKYVCEIEFEKENSAIRNRDTVSDLCEKQYLKVIDEILNKYDNTEIIQIESINIELGKFFIDELVEKSSVELKEKLESELKRIIGEIRNQNNVRGKIICSEEYFLEQLSQFLKYGYINYSNLSGFPRIKELISNCIKENINNIINLLRLNIEYFPFIQRFIQHSEDNDIFGIINEMDRTNINVYVKYYKEIINVKKEIRALNIKDKSIRTITLYFFLKYLISERGSYFNKKQFLIWNLKQYAAKYNLKYSYFIQLFKSALESLNKNYPGGYSIFQLIFEIANEETENDEIKDENESSFKNNESLILDKLNNLTEQQYRELFIKEYLKSNQRRFVKELLEKNILENVVVKIDSQNKNTILIYSEEMSKLWKKNKYIETSEVDFEITKWVIILNIIIQNYQNRLNRKYFLKNLLKQIAAHYNLSLFILLYNLNKICEIVKNTNGFIDSDFLLTITELMEDEKVLLKLLKYEIEEDKYSEKIENNIDYFIQTFGRYTESEKKKILQHIFSSIKKGNKNTLICFKNAVVKKNHVLLKTTFSFPEIVIESILIILTAPKSIEEINVLQNLLRTIFKMGYNDKTNELFIKIISGDVDKRDENKNKIAKTKNWMNLDYIAGDKLLKHIIEQEDVWSELEIFKKRITLTDILIVLLKKGILKKFLINITDLELNDIIEKIIDELFISTKLSYKTLLKNSRFYDKQTKIVCLLITISSICNNNSIINELENSYVQNNITENQRDIILKILRKTHSENDYKPESDNNITKDNIQLYIMELSEDENHPRQSFNHWLEKNYEITEKYILNHYSDYKTTKKWITHFSEASLKEIVEIINPFCATEILEMLEILIEAHNQITNYVKINQTYKWAIIFEYLIYLKTNIYNRKKALGWVLKKTHNLSNVTEYSEYSHNLIEKIGYIKKISSLELNNEICENLITLITELNEKKTQNKKWTEQETSSESLQENDVFIRNSGIVLIEPFIKKLFELCGIDLENPENEYSKDKAVSLLNYIMCGTYEFEEIEIYLLKIICGINSNEVISSVELEQNELEICDNLIKHIIESWRALGNTSISGLRGSFFLREGKLSFKENGWHLIVQQKTYDVLLDSIPWNYKIIKYKWMNNPIYVNWR